MYKLEINQIGQKELIQKSSAFQKNITIEDYFMMPLLDERNNIDGT